MKVEKVAVEVVVLVHEELARQGVQEPVQVAVVVVVGLAAAIEKVREVMGQQERWWRLQVPIRFRWARALAVRITTASFCRRAR